MKKKKDIKQAQAELTELILQKKLKKQPPPIKDLELLKHVAEILQWANLKGCSKCRLARLIFLHLGIETGPDRAYRFVRLMNHGIWPNGKKSK